MWQGNFSLVLLISFLGMSLRRKAFRLVPNKSWNSIIDTLLRRFGIAFIDPTIKVGTLELNVEQSHLTISFF